MRRKSLLILECNSPKLRQQRLSFIDEAVDILKLTFPRGGVERVPISTTEDLIKVCSFLVEQKIRFKRILVIAHSNPDVIELTSDQDAIPWSIFARWISPFEPKWLYLVGCKAGTEKSVNELCANIDSLEEVYGSRWPVGRFSARLIYAEIAAPHLRKSGSEYSDLVGMVGSMSRVFFRRWDCC